MSSLFVERNPSRLFAVVGGLPAAFVIAGYLFFPKNLQIIFFSLPAMMPVTALTIVLLATTIFSNTLGPRAQTAAKAYSAFVVIFSLFTLGEYLYGIDFGVDNLLFSSKLIGGSEFPGRMSPQTCVAAVALAMALLRLKSRYLMQTLGLVALVISFLATVGFLYQAAGLFSISRAIGMAVPTAICFIFLAIGTLWLRPDQGLVLALRRQTSGGFFLRRFVVVGVLLPWLIAGLLRTGEHLGFYDADYAMAGFVFFTIVVLILVAMFTAQSLEQIEEQKLELKLRQLEVVEANEAGKLKSKFVANMSHEVRTPLTAVIGYLECLRERNLTTDQRLEYSARAERCATGLLKVLEDVLDLSRIESDHLNTVARLFKPKELVEDVVDQFRLEAEAKGLTLAIEYHNSIPVMLHADADRIQQILINILKNSIKFTAHGKISVIVQYAEGSLKIGVADTGIGISADVQTKLFAIFAQGDDSITRKYGGTGLGLALSRRLARLLEGDLKLISSRVNEGSLFEMTIPCKIGEQPKSATQTVVTGNILCGKRVLVVEDNADNRYLIDLFLTALGAMVEMAENGKIGVEKAMASPYHLIVMDLQMPVMGGLEAVRILRERGYKLPVLALSAHTMLEHKERSFAAGFDAHLSKPISKQELMGAIEKAMQPAV